MDIYDILRNKKGFIAALDQSGGSSKKTLVNYGIDESSITSDAIMFDYIHEMRSRIITNPVFDERIIATILFKDTMERKVNGEYTAEYLRNNKNILSFLKVDNGLDNECDGVLLMKDIPELDNLLDIAISHGIVGTKMRSLIKEYNEYGIKKIIEQQFSYAKRIIAKGLIPIIEPEVDINSPQKKQIETYMHQEIIKHLNKLGKEDYVIFKFSLPDLPNYYNDLLRYKNVLRIVALSGGYKRDIACSKLKENKKMIASFSRALLEDLKASQSEEEFSNTLDNTINEIYLASTKK